MRDSDVDSSRRRGRCSVGIRPDVEVGTDTPAPEDEQDDADFENGGVDGTRTRDLRRDRRKE